MTTVKKALVILSLSKDQPPLRVTFTEAAWEIQNAFLTVMTHRRLILRQAQDDGGFLRSVVPLHAATVLLKPL